MIPRSRSTWPASSGRAERAVEQRRVLGGARVERQRDQHGALALDQVVAGGLAGGGRVAEDAEQVVAQLERLAERQPERRQLGHRPRRRRRRARRRCAAAARWSTSPTCSAAPSSRRRRRRGRGPAPTRRGTGRRSPRERHRSKTSSAAATCSSGRPQRRSSSSAQLSSRSPSRIAAAAPYCSGSPRQPAPRCSASNARCVAGRPRRVSEASMKSSWTSALACSSSSAAQARTSASSSAGRRARRRGSPSSRTPRGTACRRRPSARASSSSRAASSPSGASALGLLVEELVERGLDARRGSSALSHGSRSSRGRDYADVGPPAPAAGRPRHLDCRAWPGEHARAASASSSATGERSFSFEFFPPKDEAGEEQLWQAISELEPLPPDLRLGDLRRRRHHPRHHRRGSPAGSPARPR